jgi:hypothetical protein
VQQGVFLDRSGPQTHVNSNEFKQTVLRQDRHDDFMTGIRVIVQQWQAAGMCLYE